MLPMLMLGSAILGTCSATSAVTFAVHYYSHYILTNWLHTSYWLHTDICSSMLLTWRTIFIQKNSILTVFTVFTVFRVVTQSSLFLGSISQCQWWSGWSSLMMNWWLMIMLMIIIHDDDYQRHSGNSHDRVCSWVNFSHCFLPQVIFPSLQIHNIFLPRNPVIVILCVGHIYFWNNALITFLIKWSYLFQALGSLTRTQPTFRGSRYELRISLWVVLNHDFTVVDG